MAKSRENNTTTLLGLKDYKAVEVVRGDDRIVAKITVNGGREKCPYCGSEDPYKHGMYKPRQVLHTWTNGTKVYLDLHRQRWKCRDCGHTFIEGKELVSNHNISEAASIFGINRAVVYDIIKKEKEGD